MFTRIIRADFARNRLITVIMVLFVAAASLLVSLSVMLTGELIGAYDTLVAQAKPSHFLQMHRGEIDISRLADFAKNEPTVSSYEVMAFLNIENARITLGDKTMTDSVQDHGFSTQSKEFDFLVGLKGEILDPRPGELYVPVCYYRDGTVREGDTAVVSGRTFVVAGFLRDAQMNSMLASSKRLLINQEDFDALVNEGDMEYLISFRLRDLSMIPAFSATYEAAGLPSNGPTITYPLFRALSAISDGIMIAVLLTVGFLVTGIAFLCIRFTLLSKMKEDERQIGILKAIGIAHSDISRMYLVSYMVISGVGAILGYTTSFLFRDPLLRNIRLNFGESGNAAQSPFLAAIGVAMVILLVFVFVCTLLRRFRYISAAEAVRSAAPQASNSSHSARSFTLQSRRKLPANVFIGIRDILLRKRLYVTLFTVLVIAAGLMLIPQFLLYSIQSREYASIMGAGYSDIRFDFQNSETAVEESGNVARKLQEDPDIERLSVLVTRSVVYLPENGIEESIRVTSGNHEMFPVTYAEGRAPTGDDSIALSLLYSEELGKKTGDPITLIIGEQERIVTVSGIYSDVTNGGKSSRIAFDPQGGDVLFAMISADVKDPSADAATVSFYQEQFPHVKITQVPVFMRQTMGPLIDGVGMSSLLASAVSLLLFGLVTALFMRLLIAGDGRNIAVLMTIGFTRQDVSRQYISRFLPVATLAVLIGVAVSFSAGEAMTSMMIQSFGAAGFRFSGIPPFIFVLYPMLMLGTVIVATMLGSTRIKGVRITERMKEI